MSAQMRAALYIAREVYKITVSVHCDAAETDMKAKTDYPLLLSGLLAGSLLGAGHIGGAVVLALVTVGGVWLSRTSAGEQKSESGCPL
jgi:hypothetical protein